MPNDTFPYNLRCPYCGITQHTSLPVPTESGLTFSLCDPEDGGCDCHFAVWTQVLYRVLTSKLDFRPSGGHDDDRSDTL
jgi:hypothetical protein